MDNLSLERLFLQNISETNQIFTTDIWELATSICENKKKTRTCICLNIQGSSHHWWTGFLQITSSSQFPSILRWGGPRKWVQSKQNISIFLTTRNFLAQNYRRCFSPRKLLITGGVPDGDTFSADRKIIKTRRNISLSSSCLMRYSQSMHAFTELRESFQQDKIFYAPKKLNSFIKDLK